MLVDRVDKETTDVTRAVIDMAWWFDPGETVTEIVSAKVIGGMFGWSEPPYPAPGAPPPYDPTPLLLQTSVMDITNTQLIVFVEWGTPGLAYTCQFVLAGTSLRQVTIELGVQVTGTPPKQPLPVPVAPTPLPATALSIEGGTMLGPIYLFADPTYPTEAASKSYVDAAIGDTVGIQAERTARIAGDANEANARTGADLVLAHQPMAFRWAGRPGSGEAMVNLVPFPLRVSFLLAGTQVFAGTAAQVNSVFTVNRLSQGATTQLGTVTMIAGQTGACLLDGMGGDIGGGDVIQVVAPGSPGVGSRDQTLADVMITLVLNKILPS